MRALIASFALLVALAAVASTPPSFTDLEESLTCQCGCGLTVHACNHLQCPSAIPLRQEIRQQMSLGLSKDAILKHFSDKYGEKILSSPTAQGFNLTAWVMPFFAIALGGVIVMFTLLRWRRDGPQRPAAPVSMAPPLDAEARSPHEKALERELERELKRYDA